MLPVLYREVRRQRQQKIVWRWDVQEFGWHRKTRQRTSHPSRMKSTMEDPGNFRSRKNTFEVEKEIRESAEAILQVSEKNLIT